VSTGKLTDGSEMFQCLHRQGLGLLDPEDASNMFRRNLISHLRN